MAVSSVRVASESEDSDEPAPPLALNKAASSSDDESPARITPVKSAQPPRNKSETSQNTSLNGRPERRTHRSSSDESEAEPPVKSVQGKAQAAIASSDEDTNSKGIVKGAQDKVAQQDNSSDESGVEVAKKHAQRVPVQARAQAEGSSEESDVEPRDKSLQEKNKDAPKAQAQSPSLPESSSDESGAEPLVQPMRKAESFREAPRGIAQAPQVETESSSDESVLKQIVKAQKEKDVAKEVKGKNLLGAKQLTDSSDESDKEHLVNPMREKVSSKTSRSAKSHGSSSDENVLEGIVKTQKEKDVVDKAQGTKREGVHPASRAHLVKATKENINSKRTHSGQSRGSSSDEDVLEQVVTPKKAKKQGKTMRKGKQPSCSFDEREKEPPVKATKKNTGSERIDIGESRGSASDERVLEQEVTPKKAKGVADENQGNTVHKGSQQACSSDENEKEHPVKATKESRSPKKIDSGKSRGSASDEHVLEQEVTHPKSKDVMEKSQGERPEKLANKKHRSHDSNDSSSSRCRAVPSKPKTRPTAKAKQRTTATCKTTKRVECEDGSDGDTELPPKPKRAKAAQPDQKKKKTKAEADCTHTTGQGNATSKEKEKMKAAKVTESKLPKHICNTDGVEEEAKDAGLIGKWHHGKNKSYDIKFDNGQWIFTQQSVGAQGVLERKGEWLQGDIKVGIIRLKLQAVGSLHSQLRKHDQSEWGKLIVASSEAQTMIETKNRSETRPGNTEIKSRTAQTKSEHQSEGEEESPSSKPISMAPALPKKRKKNEATFIADTPKDGISQSAKHVDNAKPSQESKEKTVPKKKSDVACITEGSTPQGGGSKQKLPADAEVSKTGLKGVERRELDTIGDVQLPLALDSAQALDAKLLHSMVRAEIAQDYHALEALASTLLKRAICAQMMQRDVKVPPESIRQDKMEAEMQDTKKRVVVDTIEDVVKKKSRKT